MQKVKFEVNFKKLIEDICNAEEIDVTTYSDFPEYCTLPKDKVGTIIKEPVETLVQELTIEDMEEFFEHATDYLQYVGDTLLIGRLENKIGDIPVKRTKRRVL